jgi:hypothetical protein
MYFVHAYENRTMKLVEIALRRKGRRMRINDGESESNQGKHTSQGNPPVQLIYANKNVKNNTARCCSTYL